eukprot:4601100-Pleurochrysis_carterae.AAC.1
MTTKQNQIEKSKSPKRRFVARSRRAVTEPRAERSVVSMASDFISGSAGNDTGEEEVIMCAACKGPMLDMDG